MAKNISSTTMTINVATHAQTLTSNISSTTFAIGPAPIITVASAAVPKEKPLTEAQRNKMRVLAHEYGTFSSSGNTKIIQPDINTLPESELTDLQRNRKRMMQNDLFAEYNKPALADRAHLNLHLDIECARNRRRVLESEFAILTGLTPSSTTFTLEQVLTPMSPTSDTTLTENATQLTASAAKRTDLINANVPAPLNAKTVLKINVELAN
ncbi:uncharacterized protein [Eurosta solidaginis]|uniref:uncharacterized protein n=1 Tax=Eurosta solidaginis TaxID=178769 RepID=UPI0035306B33